MTARAGNPAGAGEAPPGPRSNSANPSSRSVAATYRVTVDCAIPWARAAVFMLRVRASVATTRNRSISDMPGR
ncbi:hypothetical protein TSOC111612_18225 [Tsukamurella ocularis]